MVQVSHWLGRRLMNPYSHKYIGTGNDKLMPRLMFGADSMVRSGLKRGHGVVMEPALDGDTAHSSEVPRRGY